MKRVKSPSVAAADICAKPRTCVVKLFAMVFTDMLHTNVKNRDVGMAI